MDPAQRSKSAILLTQGETRGSCEMQEPRQRGGAKGIRTPDLFHAMETRYQLRHSPKVVLPSSGVPVVNSGCDLSVPRPRMRNRVCGRRSVGAPPVPSTADRAVRRPRMGRTEPDPTVGHESPGAATTTVRAAPDDGALTRFEEEQTCRATHAGSCVSETP